MVQLGSFVRFEPTAISAFPVYVKGLVALTVLRFIRSDSTILQESLGQPVGTMDYRGICEFGDIFLRARS